MRRRIGNCFVSFLKLSFFLLPSFVLAVPPNSPADDRAQNDGTQPTGLQNVQAAPIQTAQPITQTVIRTLPQYVVDELKPRLVTKYDEATNAKTNLVINKCVAVSYEIDKKLKDNVSDLQTIQNEYSQVKEEIQDMLPVLNNIQDAIEMEITQARLAMTNKLNPLLDVLATLKNDFDTVNAARGDTKPSRVKRLRPIQKIKHAVYKAKEKKLYMTNLTNKLIHDNANFLEEFGTALKENAHAICSAGKCRKGSGQVCSLNCNVAKIMEHCNSKYCRRRRALLLNYFRYVKERRDLGLTKKAEDIENHYRSRMAMLEQRYNEYEENEVGPWRLGLTYLDKYEKLSLKDLKYYKNILEYCNKDISHKMESRFHPYHTIKAFGSNANNYGDNGLDLTTRVRYSPV